MVRASPQMFITYGRHLLHIPTKAFFLLYFTFRYSAPLSTPAQGGQTPANLLHLFFTSCPPRPTSSYWPSLRLLPPPGPLSPYCLSSLLSGSQAIHPSVISLAASKGPCSTGPCRIPSLTWLSERGTCIRYKLKTQESLLPVVRVLPSGPCL